MSARLCGQPAAFVVWFNRGYYSDVTFVCAQHVGLIQDPETVDVENYTVQEYPPWPGQGAATCEYPLLEGTP